MPDHVRLQLLVVAVAAVIFFTNLGLPALWDMDEALYASCAREMFERGDWVVPMFNGRMFPEKPPLMFWTMMAGFELFGINEWGARFFSAVMGVGTALIVFHLGRILWNPRVGLWAGLATASTIIFTVSARAATVDMALTFTTAAAMLLFVIGRKNSGFSVLYAVPMYACIGLAILAKGPVMLLPLAAIGFYILVADLDRPGIPLALLYAVVAGSMLGECVGLLIGRWVTPVRLMGMLPPLIALGWCLLAAHGWRGFFRAIWQMRPLTGVVVVAAVALPWYLLVGRETDGRWVREFLEDFNLRPFRQPIQGHGDPSSLGRIQAAMVSLLYYFFHVPGVLVGFFPWAIFLGVAAVDAVRQIRRRARDGFLLAATWFSVWFVFWSLCKTKLPHYLLPAYPALALVTGCFVDRWLSDPASVGRWPLRNAWISLILVGIGLMVALPIVAWVYLPGEAVLGLVGLLLILGGGWCWRETARNRHGSAAVALTVTAAAFLTTAFGFAALQVDRHQNARLMMAAIRADGRDPAHVPIATYRFFRESTVFYADHPPDDPVAVCDNPDDLRDFFARSGQGYVITTNEYENELSLEFPGKLRVVFRQPCFLREGEMVVLANFQKPAAPAQGTACSGRGIFL